MSSGITNIIIQKAQKAVAARAEVVAQQLLDRASKDPFKDLFWGDAAKVFKAAYQNPILTTAEVLSDAPVKVYAGTGGWGCYGPPASSDIPSDYKVALDDMWIRDACAQYHAYLGIIADHKGQPEDEEIAALGSVIEGVVRTCSVFLTGKDADPQCPHAKDSNITVHAFSRYGTQVKAGCDYEPDSLAYLVFLAWSYEAASGSSDHLDEYFWKAMEATVNLLGTRDTDRGCLHMFTEDSALTMTPVRPSDDRAERAFNIPVNAFCAVAMEQLAYLAQKYSSLVQKYGVDPELATKAGTLGAQLRLGIKNYGTGVHPVCGQIYAYETNAGLEPTPFQQLGALCVVPQAGEPIFMDDANIPSLLSLPYIGFCPADDSLYADTRRFVLCPDNPYFYAGTDGTTQYEGVGSAHTDCTHGGTAKSIWPLAITMRGMTAATPEERKDALGMLVASALAHIKCQSGYGCPDPDLCAKYPPRGYIHESFFADNPASYTRGWFAWANALFGEWVDTMVREGTLPS
jgi:meiotically up-regulated gene 157 (Mug157) protein